jgi:UDP-glucuronate 4-epimerase
VLGTLAQVRGRAAKVRREPARPGDQRHTTADTGKLQRHLGWRATVGLDEGLARQVEWQRTLRPDFYGG